MFELFVEFYFEFVEFNIIGYDGATVGASDLRLLGRGSDCQPCTGNNLGHVFRPLMLPLYRAV